MKSLLSLLHPFFPQKLNTREETLGVCVSSVTELIEADLKDKIVILGIPDERGIILNQGHPGAKEGPIAFRKAFYSLYSGSKVTEIKQRVIDAGNIILTDDILTTHQKLSEVISFFLKGQCRSVIVIGGGHDFSYGSFSALADSGKSIIPCVNFDAHFDLRPVTNNQLNSGTPFFRIIENHPKTIANGQALLEVGIQSDRNPASLYEYADQHGVGIIELNQNHWIYNKDNQLDATIANPRKNLLESIQKHLDKCSKMGWNAEQDPIHLSLDLDVFASWLAPGTSASTPFGLHLEDLLESLEFLTTKAAVIDIAELCPPRDFNQQTARLAAGIVYRLIQKMI